MSSEKFHITIYKNGKTIYTKKNVNENSHFVIVAKKLIENHQLIKGYFRNEKKLSELNAKGIKFTSPL